MSTNPTTITVDLARTEADWRQGLKLVDTVYQRTYRSNWRARPDVLFVARDERGPVATGGLELGRIRGQFDTERYFHLPSSVAAFVEANRARTAELGRFSCLPRASVLGSQSVFRAVFRYCAAEGIDYVLGWARPELARYYVRLQRPLPAADASDAAHPFATVDVPLNEQAIRSCTAWTTPPVDFFYGQESPRLILVVVAFLQLALQGLDVVLDGVVEDLSGGRFGDGCGEGSVVGDVLEARAGS